MGGVTGGPSDLRDPWGEGADLLQGDVLEGGMQPPWWRRRWTALPRRARLLALVLVLLLAAGAGGAWLRDRAAERGLARQVDLATGLGLSSLSTTPPGGQVAFFVVVRNDGARPVWITSVEGAADGLRLRQIYDVERQLSPDGETAVPVTVRLTCRAYDGGGGLTTAVAVRREDGARVVRRVRPDAADLLTDVATRLCRSRPELRDEELSVPVLAGLEADAPGR